MNRPSIETDSRVSGPGTRGTRRSAELFERAQATVPGGAARPNLRFPPHPIFAERGEGCYLFDVDGNRYLDLHNNQASLVLGHCHPAVVEALQSQLRRGTAFGAPTELEAGLAGLIASRVASVEHVTFTTSGTDASALAISLARAFTGRKLIAKFEGGYHGILDSLYLSTKLVVDAAHGPDQRPRTVANLPGTPRELCDLVISLPFNNADAVNDILTEHASDVAAVIIEPIQVVGGTITPVPGFLQAVQAIASRLDILLVVDEVVTLRLAVGGAQEIFGLRPDLTVLGKIIGGGLPAGAVGGRAEILGILSPPGAPSVWTIGTFSGNPMTMAAGIATLTELSAETIERLNLLGEDLRDRLSRFCEEHSLPISVTGLGSLLNLHFSPKPIRSTRDTWHEDRGTAFEFFSMMLGEGFYFSPRGSLSLSVPMTGEDLEPFFDAATRNLLRVCSHTQ